VTVFSFMLPFAALNTGCACVHEPSINVVVLHTIMTCDIRTPRAPSYVSEDMELYTYIHASCALVLQLFERITQQAVRRVCRLPQVQGLREFLCAQCCCFEVENDALPAACSALAGLWQRRFPASCDLEWLSHCWLKKQSHRQYIRHLDPYKKSTGWHLHLQLHLLSSESRTAAAGRPPADICKSLADVPSLHVVDGDTDFAKIAIAWHGVKRCTYGTMPRCWCGTLCRIEVVWEGVRSSRVDIYVAVPTATYIGSSWCRVWEA
jgi:hypothetical protein